MSLIFNRPSPNEKLPLPNGFRQPSLTLFPISHRRWLVQVSDLVSNTVFVTTGCCKNDITIKIFFCVAIRLGKIWQKHVMVRNFKFCRSCNLQRIYSNLTALTSDQLPSQSVHADRPGDFQYRRPSPQTDQLDKPFRTGT